MDGTSPQAGSAFVGKKVYFDGNNGSYGKKQLCMGSIRKKISAYPSAQRPCSFKALGTAEVFSRRTSHEDSSLQGNVAEGKGRKYSKTLPIVLISFLTLIS